MVKKAGATVGAGSLIALALTTAIPNIQELEGRRTTPYYDVVNTLTVCDGHTGPDIILGKTYSPDECNKLTLTDAKKFADGVLKVNPQLAFHPNQLAAMISFAYNIGVPAYQRSSVAVLFNKGDFVGACNFIVNYNKAGGRVIQGLVLRREKERELCLSTLTPDGMKVL